MRAAAVQEAEGFSTAAATTATTTATTAAAPTATTASVVGPSPALAFREVPAFVYRFDGAAAEAPRVFGLDDLRPQLGRLTHHHPAARGGLVSRCVYPRMCMYDVDHNGGVALCLTYASSQAWGTRSSCACARRCCRCSSRHTRFRCSQSRTCACWTTRRATWPACWEPRTCGSGLCSVSSGGFVRNTIPVLLGFSACCCRVASNTLPNKNAPTDSSACVGAWWRCRWCCWWCYWRCAHPRTLVRAACPSPAHPQPLRAWSPRSTACWKQFSAPPQSLPAPPPWPQPRPPPPHLRQLPSSSQPLWQPTTSTSTPIRHHGLLPPRWRRPSMTNALASAFTSARSPSCSVARASRAVAAVLRSKVMHTAAAAVVLVLVLVPVLVLVLVVLMVLVVAAAVVVVVVVVVVVAAAAVAAVVAATAQDLCLATTSRQWRSCSTPFSSASRGTRTDDRQLILRKPPATRSSLTVLRRGVSDVTSSSLGPLASHLPALRPIRQQLDGRTDRLARRRNAGRPTRTPKKTRVRTRVWQGRHCQTTCTAYEPGYQGR
jgi:hypothetical protein